MDPLALGPEDRDLIRSLIVADPSLVLDDDDVMRRLVGETKGDRQIVDLRDRLVERLETRLDTLLSQQRSIIAAAYENVAGTNQLHRAVVALTEPAELDAFLRRLTLEVPQMLGLEEARLCLTGDVGQAGPAGDLDLDGQPCVMTLPVETLSAYLALEGAPSDTVVLRPADEESTVIFGDTSPVQSEALLRLDLGGTLAVLAFGSADPKKFDPSQATDLLMFFANVIERLLTRQVADHLAGVDG